MSTQSGAADGSAESRLAFRTDIEGLRALAIVMVVAAHAGVPWLKGGFIGVDMFFVLSGFLITGLLVHEHQRSRRIDLADFYARRFRRLLPGLVLMILVTMLAAVLLLSPGEQKRQIASASSAILWVSNLHYAFSEVDYFGPAAESDLFLHTWSLGVEEQFYLVWPLILLLVMSATGKRDVVDPVGRVQRAVLMIVVVSFLFSLFLALTKPVWAYYLPVARAWQFGTGALVFLAGSRFKTVQPSSGMPTLRSMRNVLDAGFGIAGMAMIVGTSIWIDGNQLYPGFVAVVPTIGVALVLLAGTRTRECLTSRFLSLPPMVAIGRVSYGWYLWHWPVLLIAASLLPAGDWRAAALGVPLSLALAVASYRWVERPIRASRWLLPRPWFSLLASCLLIAACLLSALLWSQAANRWVEVHGQSRFLAVRSDLSAIYRHSCDEWIHTARVKECVFGNEHASKTAVLVGDSILAQWFPALERALEGGDWRLVVITKSACPMVDQTYFYPRIGRQYTECDLWRKAAIQRIRERRPDLVFLGSSSSYPFTYEEWKDGTDRVLAALGPDVGRLILVEATQNLPFDGPDCLARLEWRKSRGVPHASSTCSVRAELQSSSVPGEALRQAASGYSNASVLALNDLVCPNQRCFAEIDGAIVYRDSQHLAAQFVASIAGEFARRAGIEDDVEK